MPPGDGGMPESHISRHQDYFDEDFHPGLFCSMTAILKVPSVSELAFKKERKEGQAVATLLTWIFMVNPHLTY